MNNYTVNKTQELKQERLFKAFEGVKYNFFAEWTDMDRLTQELLGTDIQTILPQVVKFVKPPTTGRL